MDVTCARSDDAIYRCRVHPDIRERRSEVRSQWICFCSRPLEGAHTEIGLFQVEFDIMERHTFREEIAPRQGRDERILQFGRSVLSCLVEAFEQNVIVVDLDNGGVNRPQGRPALGCNS